MSQPTVESISAVTLATADMARAVAFYDDLGLRRLYGGPDKAFTSYAVGEGYVNLQAVADPPPTRWGRIVLYVDDVDAMHAHVVDHGHQPEFDPQDAEWGERYFHLRDPDGHELSFARPL